MRDRVVKCEAHNLKQGIPVENPACESVEEQVQEVGGND